MTYEESSIERGTEHEETLYQFLELRLEAYLDSGGNGCTFSWHISDAMTDKRIRWGQGAHYSVPSLGTQWTAAAASMITHALKHLETFPTISGPVVDDTELLTGSGDQESQDTIGDHG